VLCVKALHCDRIAADESHVCKALSIHAALYLLFYRSASWSMIVRASKWQ
jgi:hypothetical protein